MYKLFGRLLTIFSIFIEKVVSKKYLWQASVDYLFAAKISDDNIAYRSFNTNKNVSCVYLSGGIGASLFTSNKIDIDIITSLSYRKYLSAQSKVYSKYFPLSKLQLPVSETTYQKSWNIGNVSTLRLKYKFKRYTIGFIGRYDLFKTNKNFVVTGLQLGVKL